MTSHELWSKSSGPTTLPLTTCHVNKLWKKLWQSCSLSLSHFVILRASVADIVKIMQFCYTKSLLYYFTTSFYNISFIRCSIFLPFHLNIISLFFLILILFFLYYLFNGNILFFLSNLNVSYSCWEWKKNKKLINPIYHILPYSCIFVIVL